MCGRFTLVTNLELWNARFQIEVIPFDMQPRYNIAPGQLIPAIISDQGKRRIGQLKWGLVPSWAQDEKSGYKMINARSETLTESQHSEDFSSENGASYLLTAFMSGSSVNRGNKRCGS